MVERKRTEKTRRGRISARKMANISHASSAGKSLITPSLGECVRWIPSNEWKEPFVFSFQSQRQSSCNRALDQYTANFHWSIYDSVQLFTSFALNFLSNKRRCLIALRNGEYWVLCCSDQIHIHQNLPMWLSLYRGSIVFCKEWFVNGLVQSNDVAHWIPMSLFRMHSANCSFLLLIDENSLVRVLGNESSSHKDLWDETRESLTT